MNTLTTTEPYSMALRHWFLLSKGGNPMCPYKQGTHERAIYDKQIKRLEGISYGI